jgi:hypothetical protein
MNLQDAIKILQEDVICLHDINLNTASLKGCKEPMILDRLPKRTFAWKMRSRKHGRVKKN